MIHYNIIGPRKRHKNVGIGRREMNKKLRPRLFWDSEEKGTYVRLREEAKRAKDSV